MVFAPRRRSRATGFGLGLDGPCGNAVGLTGVGTISSTADRSATPGTATGESRALGRAFALMLAAFAMFVVMDTSAKWLVLAGIPALQVAFLRFSVHLLLVLGAYWPREGRALFATRVRGIQLARGAMLAGATMLNFTALQHLPLPVTISIFFAGPMLVCLLSIPMLGERVGPRRIGAVLVGFLGVLVVIQPWNETFGWHVLLSLGSMCCASLYFVLSRMMRGADGNGTSQLHASVVGTVLLAPFALGGWVWPHGPLPWALLLLVGSLGFVAHSMVTRAHELAEASVLAPTVYSQIVYVSIVSWLVFASPPGGTTLLGAGIIIGSGLYLWWRERRLVLAGRSDQRSDQR